MAGAADALEALVSRGWSFRDPNHVLDLVRIKTNQVPEIESQSVLEMVELELLNTDLRSMGGKSLPDATKSKKLSHLQGPKILQVVATRDICQSSFNALIQNLHPGTRLLRFVLTDGYSEVTAIEYAPISFICKEIIPGSKVRLENKIPIHNGILCLDSKTVTVLGGVVESLYEEWQVEQKYSSISRSITRHSNNNNGTGPPPFEKLQLGKQSRDPPNYNSQCSSLDRLEGSIHRCHGEQFNESISDVIHNANTSTTGKDAGDHSSISSSRPREAIEIMPIQNQAAAQKLLQKMVQPNQGKWPGRTQRHRAKAEETPVFTLEEWENRKASTSKPVLVGEMMDVSRDEELARQLQRQLDLEDFHDGKVNRVEAEKIKMSMFNFQHGQDSSSDRRESRGRGRGRGRGGGRGRGF